MHILKPQGARWAERQDEGTSLIGLWISRILMAGYVLFALERVIHLIQGQDIVIQLITLLVALSSVLIHYRVQAMIRAGQQSRAARWMMLTNLILLGIIQASDAGNSPLTGITYGLVSAVIASYLLPEERTARGIFLAFSGGAFIAIFDYILPGRGGGLDFHSLSLYILLAVDVIFIWLLLRPFLAYPMNVKSLLAMTLLTLLAVIITFLSIYLVISYQGADAGLLFAVERVAVIAGALFVVVSQVVSSRIVRLISGPLVKMVKNIQRVSETGDYTQIFDIDQQGEVSLLAQALNEMNAYFKQLSETAGRVSTGDLTVSLKPRSEKDLLAHSFIKMIESQRQLVGLIHQSADQLSSASDHLNQVVDRTDQMTATILQAVEHVLLSDEQVNSGDSASFRQLARAIESIAHGAQDQARAVSQAAGFSAQIGAFVGRVNENVQMVQQHSQDTASNAYHGVQVMEEMVGQIENIRVRVQQSAARVAEMGEESNKIEEIVSAIEAIASQTNLLALNTAIEAARSSAHTAAMAENILDHTMEAQAWLIAHLLRFWTDEMGTEKFWVELARQCHMDNINVTDEDGVVVYTNEIPKIGFRFSDDPKAQTYVFRELIGKPGAVVCRPLQKRTVDDRQFKYVGIARIDRPGIIQVGFDGSSIERYKSGGGVFSVISEQILQLARQTQLATKEIMELNQKIQHAVNEAVSAMIEGEREVDGGVNRAGLAREALDTILKGADSIKEQVEQAAASVEDVNACTRDLSEAMDSVSAVVEENTAATEEMAAGTHEVSESVQMITQLVTDMSQDMGEIKEAVQSLAMIVQNAGSVLDRYRM